MMLAPYCLSRLSIEWPERGYLRACPLGLNKSAIGQNAAGLSFSKANYHIFKPAWNPPRLNHKWTRAMTLNDAPCLRCLLLFPLIDVPSDLSAIHESHWCTNHFFLQRDTPKTPLFKNEQDNHSAEYDTALVEITQTIREQIRLIEGNPFANTGHQRRIN